MNTTGNYRVLEATNELQDFLIRWKRELMMDKYLFEYQKNDTDFDPTKRLRILEKLCKEGADLQYLENERGFALIPRVFWSEELIQFFVDRGMDINSKDENGDSVLHLAIRHGLFDLVPAWRSGQDYFKQRNPNYDPVKVIKFILSCDQNNADARATNLLGETPFLTLAQTEEMCKSLKSKKGLQEIWEVSKMLLKRADVEALNADCESVLHLSPGNDSFIGVFKGDINVRSARWLYSKTPLMEAARSNNLKCCQLLVQRGADVHVRDFQGYTALHHAVLEGANKCAEFLVKTGGAESADPNEKSVFGKDCYELGIYHSIQYHSDRKVFTCKLVTPAKRAEILELAGALHMILGIVCDLGIDEGLEMWKTSMEFRKNLQHSEQFLNNYEFFKQNLNNPSTNRVMFQSALDNVTRLTEGNRFSRFWHLLNLVLTIEMHRYNEVEDDLDLGLYTFYSMYVFEILNQIIWQDKLQRVEDFVSLEETDFSSLLGLVDFFSGWLKILVSLGTKKEATPVRISQFHFIAHLIVACLNRTMHETTCKKVSETLMQLYVKLCLTLTFVHSKFEDVISKTAHDDNKRLLRTLVELDPRDRYGDSLVHNILKDCFYDGEFEEIIHLLDFVDIKKKNARGFEPLRSIHWHKDDGPDIGDPLCLEVVVKLADMGVHVDARSVLGGPTLREMFQLKNNSSLAFKYDSLQCACARVLVRSLVPYRSLQKQNRLPKPIVEFIDSHLQF